MPLAYGSESSAEVDVPLIEIIGPEDVTAEAIPAGEPDGELAEEAGEPEVAGGAEEVADPEGAVNPEEADDPEAADVGGMSQTPEPVPAIEAQLETPARQVADDDDADDADDDVGAEDADDDAADSDDVDADDEADDNADGANDDAPAATSSPADYAPALDPVSGVVPLLVIVTGYLGDNGVGAVPYETGYDWADTIFTSKSGVSAYYDDMSGGLFTFAPAAETSAYGIDGNTNVADAENDGIVHVSMAEAHGNWGDAYYTDTKVAGSMLAAFGRILSAASAYVDFASYDADGDGALATTELALAFIIAGYEAAIGGDMPDGAYSLWSHSWSYTDAGLAKPKVDGVMLDQYIAIAEKMRETDGAGSRDAQEPLSVLMHELGHYLGLPDLYATDNDAGDWSDYAVDGVSLMATGNWAIVEDSDGTRYQPVALDAWSRYQLGWVTPTVVTKSGVYTVSSQDSPNGYSVLLIPTSNEGEYYLIENRTFTGHDAGLAGEYSSYTNGGIVIWHIDNGIVSRYLASNQVNDTTHRPGVMPLFAEESDEDWTYVLDFSGSIPDNALLFWSKAMWQEYFSGYDVLDLPLYGSGDDADDPVARLLSGIRIEFLTDSGAEMMIRIMLPEVEEEAAAIDDEIAPTTERAIVKKAAASPVSGEDAARIPATGDEAPIAPLLALALLSAAAFAFARDRCDVRRALHAR